MPSLDSRSWQAFALRRRSAARYELCLTRGSHNHRWQIEGPVPRNPSAPRSARYLGTTDRRSLLFEGESDDGSCLVWDVGGYACEADFKGGLERGKLRIEIRGRWLRGIFALGRKKGTWRGRGKEVDISPDWEITPVPSELHSVGAPGGGSILSGRPTSDACGDEQRGGVADLLARARAPRRACEFSDGPLPIELADEVPLDDPLWLFELRPVGTRVVAATYRGKGHIVSRGGESLSRSFPELAAAMASRSISPLVLEANLAIDNDPDGELFAHRLSLTEPAAAANAAIESPATLWAFDLLSACGRDATSLPLSHRKEILARALGEAGVIRFVDHIAGHGSALIGEVSRGQTAGARVVARKDSPRARATERELDVDQRRAEEDAPVPTRRVAIRQSNRDKVFWPKSGLTKGDLLDYYERIAPVLLPHLADRPLVLTRYPDGIEGKSFFQHHAPGAKSAWLRTVRLKTSQRYRDYFVCESASDLLYLVNLGTIELHGWPSRASSIEYPDFCTIDIDRSEASHADVVSVALKLRELCDSIELPTLVKTSGGDGLHVVVPLGGALSFESARMLAEALARTLCGECSDLATVEGLIARRGGRVYIDYLVNARGKMLVVPYGVRARPGAPASTPLDWSEVTAALRPSDLNIRTVAERVAERGDPWRDLLRRGANIPRALERLTSRVKPA